MNPFFSIITPIKNGANYIPQYIYSLKHQSFKNWEAIIIDDFSTDKSSEIIRDLFGNDKRFIIKSNLTKNKKIKSPYLARNLAIDISSGKYICFLDIDDFWFPEKLERQFQIIKENEEIKLIYSNYLRFNISKNKFTKRDSIFKFIKAKHLIRIYNFIPNLTSCVERDLLSELRFKPVNHEDYLFWFEIINKISQKNIFYDDEINSLYSIHHKSISNSKIKAFFWIINIYRRFGFGNFKITIYIFIRAIIQLIIFYKEKNLFLKFNQKEKNLIEKYNNFNFKEANE